MRTLSLSVVGVGWFVAVVVFAEAPPARYSFPANGTVYDTRTKLTWQREVPGSKFDWSAAKTHCVELSLDGSNWRLPTRAELLTLIDPTEYNSAVDRSAFPNTPAESFWSSSEYAGSPGSAWSVYFNVGHSNYLDMGSKNRVRCVR